MNKASNRFRVPSMDLGVVAFAAVLTASMVLNVRLALEATAPPAVFGQSGFVSGTRLPDVAAAAAGQAVRPLTFSRDTLVYIFSPGCEWSKADYFNLKTIAQAARGKYEVLGLYVTPNDTAEDVAKYLATRPFPGPVLSVDLGRTQLSDEAVRRFGSTPQLLVVDSGGRIRQAWSGALFGSRQVEAEQYVGISLPGIRMVGGTAAPEPDSLRP